MLPQCGDRLPRRHAQFGSVARGSCGRKSRSDQRRLCLQLCDPMLIAARHTSQVYSAGCNFTGPVNGVALLVAAGAGLCWKSPSPLALSWPMCAPYVVLLISMIRWSRVAPRASGPGRARRRSSAAKARGGTLPQPGANPLGAGVAMTRHRMLVPCLCEFTGWRVGRRNRLS